MTAPALADLIRCAEDAVHSSSPWQITTTGPLTFDQAFLLDPFDGFDINPEDAHDKRDKQP